MAQVVVSSQPGKGYQHQVKAGKHSFIADMPEATGGTEIGPDPHELLLSALGACTAMTLEVFAGRRGWDLKAVSVKLVEETIENAEGKKISRITRNIEVEGDLDQEKLDSLKAIADKCPIHKLLTGEKQIETALAPSKDLAKK